MGFLVADIYTMPSGIEVKDFTMTCKCVARLRKRVVTIITDENKTESTDKYFIETCVYFYKDLTKEPFFREDLTIEIPLEKIADPIIPLAYELLQTKFEFVDCTVI